MSPVWRPPLERFVERVDVAERCWLWTGGRSGSGHGRFWDGSRQVQAHRFAWETAVGPIPAGLTLDHLCRVTNCVNPDHLEPVTHAENNRRGMSPWALRGRQTHCLRGHPLSGGNLKVARNGTRKCVACNQMREAVRTQRRRDRRAAQRAASGPVLGSGRAEREQ